MSAVTVQQAFDLAVQHHQAGRLAEAEALYRQILAVQPQHADALHHLGVIAHQVGRHDLAVGWIQQAVTLNPGNPAAHGNLGEAWRALGRLDEAVAAYRGALGIRPDIPEVYNNLGNALKEQRRFDEAAAAYRHAILLQPLLAEAHSNLASVLTNQGRAEEAIAACRRALELKADFAEAHSNLGAALAELGRFDEAVVADQRALEIRPDLAETHRNLGDALIELGRYDEALAAFHRALEIRPGDADASFSQSLAWLLHGDFARGWPAYERRWEAHRLTRRNFSQPLWDGAALPGARVLVYAEQGFGDAIQFIRYAELIAERGGQVIVECLPEMVELFRSARAVSEVVATGGTLPPFDVHVPMLSLPRIFQTTLEGIPRTAPYLSPDPGRRALWRERLGSDRTRLRVGVAWSGSPRHRHTRKRDLPFEKLTPRFRLESVEYFRLQVDDAAEANPPPSGISGMIDHREHIQDFADTAAFMAELDLIISVDTAVAHLAGALGRPVWTLLPFVPDWRWGLEREDTPWYPTMRLFRQPALGDWDTVVQRVAGELETMATQRP
ncbi:MAG: tetratricopeptide repeat protein [Chthoniobacter sp.]|uniref:tetratricopeptide repeat protein n=1 Tax=Chthoniobacter sp. TaxID=2510640 RepID=UPI0032A57ADF